MRLTTRSATLLAEARVSGPRVLLAPLMRIKFGADIRCNLSNLRQLVEGGTSGHLEAAL